MSNCLLNLSTSAGRNIYYQGGQTSALFNLYFLLSFSSNQNVLNLTFHFIKSYIAPKNF